MKSTLLKVGTVTILATSLYTGVAFAETETTSSESVSVIKASENLPFQDINKMLTDKAIAAKIPPEVVKAIAWVESKGWMQYENGAPHIGDDGKGIGIMQVTDYDPTNTAEVEKLKTDINYNIDRGLEILNEKYDWLEERKLPKVAGANRYTIENWYFPVMAYNGVVPANSPIYQENGEPNKEAYQEKVFAHIEQDSFLVDEDDIKLGKFTFTPADFDYNRDSSDPIKFLKKEYTLDQTHQSAYFFKTGDQIVTTESTKLRESHSTSSTKVRDLERNTKLTVTGPIQYEQSSTKNQFAFYPVKTQDGTKGYVSTAYIKKAPTPSITFPDVSGKYQTPVDFLVSKGINGKKDGTFGTHDYIIRADAALLLVKASGLNTEDAPASGFTDVQPRAEKEINALKAAGITKGTSAKTFGWSQNITRGELAVWIYKAFDLEPGNEKLPFNDVEGQYVEAVSALVNNDITKGTSDTTFGIKDPAKRGDFAIFLYKAAQSSAK